MKSFFRYALLALVLLVVALVSALTTMRYAIHVQEVKVPVLTGKLPAEARKIAEDSGLGMEVERRYYSTEMPAGRILSQVPTPGTTVRRGWRVRVAESLGEQRLQIASVVGQSERAAEMNIRRRGLEIGSVAHLELPDAPADRVVSQSPPPNAVGVSAPRINLLVSDPQTQRAFVMPNFAGQPLGSVRVALQDAGMRVGTVSPAPGSSSSGSPSPGSIVVAHTPAAGERVQSGSAINFQVR